MSAAPGLEAVDPLDQAKWRLRHALELVPGGDPSRGLQSVAEEMPVALSADFVNIRLLGSDHNLYLVAASGCSTIEIRKRAFQPLAVSRVREMIDAGDQAAVGESLGIRWMHVEWLVDDGAELGTVALGSRTRRRPTDEELVLFRRICTELGLRLATSDRRVEPLRRSCIALARSSTPIDWPSDGVVAHLRPREQTILELYADGLSTADIAELLVISPHTVRTHVKLAMRRLGVHARDEAATLVRSDQIAQLL